MVCMECKRECLTEWELRQGPEVEKRWWFCSPTCVYEYIGKLFADRITLDRLQRKQREYPHNK